MTTVTTNKEISADCKAIEFTPTDAFTFCDKMNDGDLLYVPYVVYGEEFFYVRIYTAEGAFVEWV